MTPHYGYGTCVTPGCPYTVPKRKITLQHFSENEDQKGKKTKMKRVTTVGNNAPPSLQYKIIHSHDLQRLF